MTINETISEYENLYRKDVFAFHNINERQAILKKIRNIIDGELNRILHDVIKDRSDMEEIKIRLIHLHYKRVAHNKVKDDIYG